MPRLLTVIAITGLALGCSESDTERLSKIGRKTVDHLENTVGGPRGQIASSYQALRGSLGEPMLDSRVATRLNWDKSLEDSKIKVNLVSPGVVRLSGKVKEGFQKQRAMDVAQSTMGVTKVVNEIVYITE